MTAAIAIFEERRADGYHLSTDPARLDHDVICNFLMQDAYWGKGMERAQILRAIAHSLPIGVYAPDGSLAAFGRVVTDYAAFAYLRDVFTLPAHRGRGIASWLARAIRQHPELLTIRTWLLFTRDAHSVYARAGYAPVPVPEGYMSIRTKP